MLHTLGSNKDINQIWWVSFRFFLFVYFRADGLKMGLSNNDDAMNKIPLKSVIDDEEKNGGEFIHDTATAEEARREQRYVYQQFLQ